MDNGCNDGRLTGWEVGVIVGRDRGCLDGRDVGWLVGRDELGWDVGKLVSPTFVGLDVTGCSEGRLEGLLLGLQLGWLLGCVDG